MDPELGQDYAAQVQQRIDSLQKRIGACIDGNSQDLERIRKVLVLCDDELSEIIQDNTGSGSSLEKLTYSNAVVLIMSRFLLRYVLGTDDSAPDPAKPDTSPEA